MDCNVTSVGYEPARADFTFYWSKMGLPNCIGDYSYSRIFRRRPLNFANDAFPTRLVADSKSVKHKVDDVKTAIEMGLKVEARNMIQPFFSWFTFERLSLSSEHSPLSLTSMSMGVPRCLHSGRTASQWTKPRPPSEPCWCMVC